MKHLIDIAISQVLKKDNNLYPNLLDTILYLNTLKHIFTSKFRIKKGKELLTFNIFKPLFI